MPTSAPRTRARAANGAGPLADRYDAVIVGARVAGSATAMLLARQGLRVLAIDRDGYGSDTLSTHALMRGAVTQLERWGVAPALRAVTPAIENVRFHYGPDTLDLPITDKGASALMAPRRTVLDRTMVDAAAEAGAMIRHHTKLASLDTHPTGRVCGLVVEDPDGRRHRIRTDLVVGADGLRSTVARMLDVPITRQGTEASAYVHPLSSRISTCRPTAYQWLYRPGVSAAGVIPTTDGQFAVFAAMPRERFRDEIRADVGAGYPAGARRGRPGGCRGRAPGSTPVESCPAAGPAWSASSARPTAPAGPWWATPATSRTRSRPTASATPCATPSWWPTRWSPAASTPTRRRGTGCRPHCSGCWSGSPPTTGRSTSCPPSTSTWARPCRPSRRS